MSLQFKHPPHQSPPRNTRNVHGERAPGDQADRTRPWTISKKWRTTCPADPLVQWVFAVWKSTESELGAGINTLHVPYGGFLKWWYPTTMGFPTKNDHFGVFWGYHHLRKHPYVIPSFGGLVTRLVLVNLEILLASLQRILWETPYWDPSNLIPPCAVKVNKDRKYRTTSLIKRPCLQAHLREVSGHEWIPCKIIHIALIHELKEKQVDMNPSSWRSTAVQ